jgi:hypothetical protein
MNTPPSTSSTPPVVLAVDEVPAILNGPHSADTQQALHQILAVGRKGDTSDHRTRPNVADRPW